VIWIDSTGYVVSPLDGVNGFSRNLLGRIGVAVGQAQEDAAVLTPPGMNSGNIKLAMNNRLISGTPRIRST
jgi:hypothetical protein